jgi:FkbM family methyltransferase
MTHRKIRSYLKYYGQALCGKFGYRLVPEGRLASRDDPWAAMAHLLKKRPELILFDVGAHKGETASEMRKTFPRAQIFSFEPFKQSYETLASLVSSDPHTHCFNIGFSDALGTKEFHVNALAATSSLLAPSESAMRSDDGEIYQPKEKTEIALSTLDTFVVERDIPQIDILKLDVQCAEPLVMKGAERLCKDGKILLIYAELVCANTYQDQPSLPGMLEAYYSRNFVLYNVYNIKLDRMGMVAQMDAIFCFKPWLKVI